MSLNPVSIRIFTVLLTLSALFMVCSSEDGSSAAASDDTEEISLSGQLLTPGKTVALDTAAGSTVNAVTTDSDADGSADGLDLNNDQNLDLVYINGSLGKPSVGREVITLTGLGSIAFQIVGSNTLFYFKVSAGKISIFSDDEGTSVTVNLVTDESGENVIGLNASGGTAVEVEFALPVPLNAAAYLVSTNPVNHSTIGPATEIVLTFSVDLYPISTVVSTTLGTYSISTTQNEVTLSGSWNAGAQTLTIQAYTNNGGLQGDPFPEYTLNFNVDGSAPVWISQSGDMTAGQTGQIVFDEGIYNVSVDTFNGGSPFPGDLTVEVTTTNLLNDTLNITPTGGQVGDWTGGCDSVDITVSDQFGNTGSDFLYFTTGGC